LAVIQVKLSLKFFLQLGLAVLSLATLFALTHPRYDPTSAAGRVERLLEEQDFQYPLEDYFPEIPMTMAAPPEGQEYHAAEDCFAPAGTPVYAIGDGKISYSGRKRGYGWLIIIDHPELDAYSLYGHLSTRRWKQESGEVKKGDLIAYLGEASETDTHRPHIHFGLRLGQRKDYATIGNQRWMAGYTTCRPDLVGWLVPSEIIGETQDMREWKQLIRKREDIDPDRALQAGDFKITSATHTEKEDLDAVIKAEFGEDYRLADWREIKAFSMDNPQWADQIGLSEGEANGLLVSNDGYKIWLGRQYFICRLNHDRPRHFLAHDSIDNDLVCLGSWQDLHRRALAVRQ
jgi:murein DD-endopeptidase MepM/ murein hydrolase activator NlpD